MTSTVYGQSYKPIKNLVYTIGDRMTTSITDSTKTLSQKHYDGGFPFPKGDLFGICNNFKSAHFFIDDKSECT